MVLATDETRLEKLESWLHSQGVPTMRIGDEVTMPSPFKEADKRKHGAGPGYVDDKFRLSATIKVDQDTGKALLRWQCWYSKGKDGKTFGGRSAFALAKRTGVAQQRIMELLGLEYDEAVAQADNDFDKITAIVTQPMREAPKVDHSSIWDHGTPFDDPVPVPPPVESAIPTLSHIREMIPHMSPLSRTPLFVDNPLGRIGESWVTMRGIDPACAAHYQLFWDHDREEVILPFWGSDGCMWFYQWYSQDKREQGQSPYWFPSNKENPALPGRGDLLFGEFQYANNRPLIVCEGVWDAITLYGVGISGSTLTEQQLARMVSLNPPMVILAFDNDTPGIAGAKDAKRKLEHYLPGVPIMIIFPPASYNDWNKIAERHGQLTAVREFRQRVQDMTVTGDPITTSIMQIIQ